MDYRNGVPSVAISLSMFRKLLYQVSVFLIPVLPELKMFSTRSGIGFRRNDGVDDPCIFF